MASLAAMGIGMGTSLIGGFLGSKAANQAAQQQAAAATEAANYAQTSQRAATGAQDIATQRQIAGAQPYQQAGAGAVGQLSAALGPGGYLSSGWNQTFQAPTAAQVEARPDYQFALQQGLQGLQRSAAAGGNLLSGGALKSAMQYGTGLASQTYQQSFNNALNTYQTNYGTFANNQQNLYNRLMGVSGLGAQTTANLNQALGTGAINAGNIQRWGSEQYGQDVTNRGAALAAGTIGAANAWRGALSGMSGAADLYAYGPQQGGGQVADLSSTLGNLSQYEPSNPTSMPGFSLFGIR